MRRTCSWVMTSSIRHPAMTMSCHWSRTPEVWFASWRRVKGCARSGSAGGWRRRSSSQARVPPREEGDCVGGELLGDRRHVEDRARGDRDPVLELGRAVALAVDELAVAGDGDGGARCGRITPLLEDRVDGCDFCAGETLREEGWGEGGEGEEE